MVRINPKALLRHIIRDIIGDLEALDSLYRGDKNFKAKITRDHCNAFIKVLINALGQLETVPSYEINKDLRSIAFGARVIANKSFTSKQRDDYEVQFNKLMGLYENQ